MIREQVIADLVKGRDVLDIGSVGQTGAYNLWNLMEPQAASLSGIDTEPSNDVRIVQGDMETHDFGRQFDVVVAGDTIEHVSNPGLFLDNVLRHMRDDGRFVLTTPNAKWFTVALKPNPTHTHWHDYYTLSYLLARHGFKIETFRYYPGNKQYSAWQLPLVARQGMLFVLSKAAKAGMNDGDADHTRVLAGAAA